ncbi:DUF3857 domain-containing transglutaminase family protein [Frigidibacter sp. RF13]|uniref:DUF3857 domain-containing transglutaminase family protein n=1 Tax=Frigidibacter sp. RF13 TaxID=2997340 RepID=UPI00226EB959|nr:DUF3857 domain-containing transglutaminase family protein [Frigidibacter sp. RF13]MCY1126868.1 DUF3857 domain-containing transglutaminase family protein [Frigidibacter sp. RF13]
MRLMWMVCLAFVTPLAAFAGDYGKAPAPPWVEETEVPPMTDALRAASYGGIAYLMDDTQSAYEGEVKISYGRYVMQVTDRAGLERAGTVQYDFDPNFESLRLVHLDVRRGDEVIHYADRVKEEVFRRETRLDAGIIDGQLTVHWQIPDLRVGDVVDYAVYFRRDALFDGANRSGGSRMEFGVPVGLVHHSVLWPRAWPFHQAPVPDRVEHSETDLGSVKRFDWWRKGHMPFPDEALTPVEDVREAEVSYGAWGDWQPLNEALSPYYDKEYDLPESWLAKLDAIRAKHSSRELQATAALRLVQDEIRYVGIEVGVGGYFARAPAEVVAAGFGDCKDKSLLLVTSLRALGIDADVALTDLDEGYRLANAVPAIRAFDHMIARVRIGMQTFWVDPTATHEAGRLRFAVTPDYGYALPIGHGGSEGLQPVAPLQEQGWLVDSSETFEFGLLGVYLTVEDAFLGEAANGQRRRWAEEPALVNAKAYLDFYASVYPGIRELTPPKLQDDAEQNEIKIRAGYFIPRNEVFLGELGDDFPFFAENWGKRLVVALSGTRETPLLLGSAMKETKKVIVINAPLDFLPPESVAINNDGFFFSFSGYAPEPGRMELSWSFRTKGRKVPADKVRSVVADARRISDATYWSWDMTPE